MIDIPSSPKEIKDRVKTDVQGKLSSTAFLSVSWIMALSESFADRVFDFFQALLASIEEVFPDTTTLYVERWASWFGMSKISATPSTGYINFQGSGLADPIPEGHIFVDGNGNTYRALETKGVSFNVASQTSLTQTGGVATMVLNSDHFYAPGDEILISNAADSEYNGTFVVTPVSNNSFTYNIDSGAPASTTGAFVSYSGNEILVEAETFGTDGNLDPFTSVSLQSAVTGIDSAATIAEDGLTGARDRETTESLRARLLDRIRNPVAHFNESDIRRIAKTVAGITRVFVEAATPAEGQVTIYLMTDGDDSVIPGAAKVDQGKAAILTIKPANTSVADVIVNAPVGVPVNFTFSSITPNSETMRNAVIENLRQFFAEKTEVGVDVDEDAYRSAAFATVNTNTGESLTNISISSPSGDVSISSGEIATLGTVSFS